VHRTAGGKLALVAVLLEEAGQRVDRLVLSMSERPAQPLSGRNIQATK